MTFYVPFGQFRTHDLSAGRLSTTLLITAPTDQFSAAEIVFAEIFLHMKCSALEGWCTGFAISHPMPRARSIIA